MFDKDQYNNKRIHIIGVGGAGMSAIAKLLKDMGAIITGSDEGVYPPISTLLESYGITPSTPYRASNIRDDVDMIIIGKNKKLLKETNEEVQAAYNKGVPILSFPEVLHTLTKNTHTIVVAGSSGKTTTTGLIAHCLQYADKDSSYFIGGIPITIGNNAQANSGTYFVLEGDEYPASHDNNKSKFLFYNARDVLVTSMTHDHFNIFPTQESYNQPFVELIQNTPDNGKCVINIDNKETHALLNLHKHTTTYGLTNSAQWSATDIHYGDTITFTITHNGVALVKVATSLLGKHNVANIVGAAAMLLEKEYITKEEFQKAVASYKGVKNRLEKINTHEEIHIYEGFGSSREKVRSAIEALSMKEGRLIVVFEPHAISWQLKQYVSMYDNLFDGADIVYVYAPTLHKSEITPADITQHTQKDIRYITSTQSGLTDIMQEVKKGDTILTLSSGSIDGLRDILVDTI